MKIVSLRNYFSSTDAFTVEINRLIPIEIYYIFHLFRLMNIARFLIVSCTSTISVNICNSAQWKIELSPRPASCTHVTPCTLGCTFQLARNTWIMSIDSTQPWKQLLYSCMLLHICEKPDLISEELSQLDYGCFYTKKFINDLTAVCGELMLSENLCSCKCEQQSEEIHLQLSKYIVYYRKRLYRCPCILLTLTLPN